MRRGPLLEVEDRRAGLYCEHRFSLFVGDPSRRQPGDERAAGGPSDRDAGQSARERAPCGGLELGGEPRKGLGSGAEEQERVAGQTARRALDDAAAKLLEEGNTDAAANLLQAFINQIEAKIRSGKISQEEGQALIDAAESILNGL